MNITKNACYFDYLRYCLDDTLPLPESSNKIDWKEMMVWADMQAIVGIIFGGIKKAGQTLNIPFNDLMKWIGYTQVIESQNKLVNKGCEEIAAVFQKDGFTTCILKGQGNALMYPNPYSRTPGDIDVWIHGEGLKVKDIIAYVRGKNTKGKVCYHHIDYGMFNGIEVEVHYRPSFMFNPIHNHRLQVWFRKMAEGGCLMAALPENTGSIRVPNREFNIIFQLSHIYNHVLHEGIGLRQIVDYFYLLRSAEDKLIQLQSTLKYLGLEKIAGAIMWVLNEVLGLPEEYLIVPMDEKRGQILLNEILKGGNFGKYDDNNIKANNSFRKNVQRIVRDIRLMRYYPSECLWEPVFRVYHFFWRLMNK